MKRYYLFGAGCIFMTQLATSTLCAQETNTIEIIKQLQQRIDDLEKKVKQLESASPAATESSGKDRVQDLEQQVKVLQRNRELDLEASEAKAKDTAKLTIGADGFGFSSGDGAFALQLKGVLQVDSRSFFEDSGIKGNDSILLRRARPVLQGTLFRDFDFLFVPDFGGTGNPQIFDAYLNYRYSPALQLQAGKFKSPIGLEQLQADVDILFNERALPTALVPNRDLGFELHGDLFGGIASYAAGIFNGVGDARNSSNFDFEDDKAFEGRLFVQPFKKSSAPGLENLGIGVAGSYESMQGANAAGLPGTTGGTLPGFATDGQQQFFAYNPASNAVVGADGEHWRLSPQGYYYYGPFGLMGEYVISDQRVSRTVTRPFTSARLDNRAWQVTGSWVLTGEDAVYKGRVVPRSPFNPAQGDWGAFQLVGRYAELDVDDAAFPLFANPGTSARSAKAWSVGLNWYLNRNVVFKTSFSHTIFSGGGGSGSSAPATVTRTDENVLFTRIQLSF